MDEVSHEFAASTYDWLLDPTHPPVPAEWVPGANDKELSSLNALGGIAAGLLPKRASKRLPAVVADWIHSSPTAPKWVVEDASRAFASDPDQSLATAYARLVRAANRRRLGTFFTPAPEVKLMLDMWDAHQPPPSTVIDVGAGVGVFTAAAARQWPRARIVAVDINPVTLGLLGVRLYRHDITTFGKVTLHHGDFTSDLYEEPSLRQQRRLILGNPPYTRAQLLPVSERRRLEALAGGLCNSRASLSTVITAISLLDLKATDGLCLLLPAQWLEADYARELRATLWKSERRRIELRLVESSLFDEALVDAVALLVGPETARPGLFMSNWSQEPGPPLNRVDATCPPNWRTLFASVPCRQHESVSAGARTERNETTLGTFAKVRRGLATGANRFFVFTTAEKVSANLDPYLQRTIVGRLRDMPDALRTSDPSFNATHRWLLQADRAQASADQALAQYIRAGETDDLHERHLCSTRRDWFDLTAEVTIPDVIVAPMTRERFRVIVNDAAAAISNNLYGVTWLTGTPEETRGEIVDWLRSDEGQRALKAIARQQGSGLLKIEPKSLQRLPLPSRFAPPAS